MKKSMLFRLICISLSILKVSYSDAQQHVGIAYYDVDHLYDTLPALFYNDEAHTPEGRLHWNTERYARKIRHTAAVIDSMALPIVALWGVENEQVVRDIAAACEGDYSYLHRTLNSLDGMDFALLYYADVFNPLYDESGRRYLYIEGVLHHPALPGHHPRGRPIRPSRTDTIALALCSDTRTAEWLAGDLREDRPEVKLIMLGRSSSINPARFGLCDALARPTAVGRGNVRYRNGWKMRDRILADTALQIAGGDVYARRYLFDRQGRHPLPTYEKETYTGGYSYALPVFIYLR